MKMHSLDRGKPAQPVKKFTVEFDGVTVKNQGDAIQRFKAWRRKYGYNEPLNILRVKKESVFTIYYQL